MERRLLDDNVVCESGIIDNVVCTLLDDKIFKGIIDFHLFISHSNTNRHRNQEKFL